MIRAPLLLALLCAGSLATPALAQAAKAKTPAEAAYLRENDKAMGEMMSGMEVAPTGDVDRDFALMMIPHHQGAIDMARALLKYGKNAELRALATRIIAAQTKEIALMRRIAGPAPKRPATSKPMDMGHMHHGM